MDLRLICFIAPTNDIHANVVAEHIGERAQVTYIDLGAVVERSVVVVPGELVRLDGAIVASRSSTVWWRRTGYIPPDPSMSAAENRFRAEEARAQLVGGLLSLDPRWVDHPGVVETAEHTFLQLAMAREAGATIPKTVATNVPDVVRRMSAKYDLVAKPISSGVGISPYADHVTDELVELLPNAPTVVQELIAGTGDLRVVVIGDDAFAWRRVRRAGEPFDWRMADPKGAGFHLIDEPEVAAIAVEVTRRLGLTFSAQDWVETPDGPVFLEVNPVGQWLFLAQADEVIGASLANHLLAQESLDD